MEKIREVFCIKQLIATTCRDMSQAIIDYRSEGNISLGGKRNSNILFFVIKKKNIDFLFWIRTKKANGIPLAFNKNMLYFISQSRMNYLFFPTITFLVIAS